MPSTARVCAEEGAMPPVPQYIATLMSDLARLEGKVDNFIGQIRVCILGNRRPVR